MRRTWLWTLFADQQNTFRLLNQSRLWRVFEKIEKSRKMAAFLTIFGLILALFLIYQSYDFDAFGCRMTVQNFMKIVGTGFE